MYKKNSFIVIYSLSDSESPDIIRYVGQTSNLKRRLNDHKNPNRDCYSHTSNWIRSVLKSGRDIKCSVLSLVFSRDLAISLEIAYIKEFREKGFDLTNATDGGDGRFGYKYSEEEKKEIGDRSRAAWALGRSKESIEKTAAAHRGMKRSKETCERISAAKKGKTKGIKFTSQHKQNISEGLKGKPKPYMAAINRQPWTPERREAQSRAQIRRHHGNLDSDAFD